MTELPDNSVSPAFLKMASDSPVSSDSFTSIPPLRTTASAQIWLPLSSSKISCSCTSAMGTDCIVPLRSILAFGCDKSVSFSINRFAFNSCAIPMTVFKAITKIKNKFDHAWTAIKAMAISRFNKLNSVHTLSRKICAVVLEAVSFAFIQAHPFLLSYL